MDEKRYCGTCRQEIGSEATRCPHCGCELPSSISSALPGPSSRAAPPSRGCPDAPPVAAPAAGTGATGSLPQSTEPTTRPPVTPPRGEPAITPTAPEACDAERAGADGTVGNFSTVHATGEEL